MPFIIGRSTIDVLSVRYHPIFGIILVTTVSPVRTVQVFDGPAEPRPHDTPFGRRMRQAISPGRPRPVPPAPPRAAMLRRMSFRRT